MSAINPGMPLQNIPLTSVGNGQPASDPGAVGMVQIGTATHTVEPNTQETQSVVQGGQVFPGSHDPNVIETAGSQLHVPSSAAQPQPVENRTVAAVGTEQAKALPSYKFTFDQLDKISKGKYNKGEVALDKNGKLMKANNHVHNTDDNNVVSTPEENARLRQQVFDCIADKFALQGPERAVLREILLDGDNSYLSLSRDELRQIIKGAKGGGLEPGSDALAKLKADLQDIRTFRNGGLRSDKSMAAMRDRGLIKGLSTSKGKVVSEVTDNAKQDRVVERDLILSLVNNEQTAYDGNGMGSAAGLLQSLFQGTGRGGQYANPLGGDGKLQVHWGDILELTRSTQIEMNAARVPMGNGRQRFAEIMLPKVERLCEERLARLNPMHANPGEIIKANSAKPDAEIKDRKYVRESVISFANDKGERCSRSSNFSFMNSVINAVQAGSNADAKQKLAGMFNENGFQLYDNNKTLRTYSYDDQNLPRSGDFSLYEESLNAHFKQIKGPEYNHGGGEASDAAKVLGMETVKINSSQSLHTLGDTRGMRNLVGELNTHLQEGRFLTCFDDGHYVAVTKIELLDDNSVKMSIVDDRADRNGNFVYTKTYSASNFCEMCSPNNILGGFDGDTFNVLQFPSGNQPAAKS